MTARLHLVRHATSAETRAARFPATTGAQAEVGCAGLDEAGRRAAEDLRPHLPHPDRIWSSWAVRAIQTAAAAGWEPEPSADLAECDFGDWAGRDVHDVAAADPEGFAAWLADPTSGPVGGEPLGALRARARRVLDRCEQGTTVAFTHGGLIRAVLAEALELPAAALARVDLAPASVTVLHGHDGAWRLVRLNWTPVLVVRPAAQAEAVAP